MSVNSSVGYESDRSNAASRTDPRGAAGIGDQNGW